MEKHANDHINHFVRIQAFIYWIASPKQSAYFTVQCIRWMQYFNRLSAESEESIELNLLVHYLYNFFYS